METTGDHGEGTVVSWPLRHRGRFACTWPLERRTAGCVLFVTCHLLGCRDGQASESRTTDTVQRKQRNQSVHNSTGPMCIRIRSEGARRLLQPSMHSSISTHVSTSAVSDSIAYRPACPSLTCGLSLSSLPFFYQLSIR